MNKLAIFNDKAVPFEWDDIDWLQESIRDAFYGLLSAFGVTEEDSFIISGCVVGISDGAADVADGYISFEGEICQVDAASITWTGEKIVRFALLESDDPTGSETDIDSNTVECYKIRKATIIADDAAAGQMLYNAPTLQDILKTLVFDDATAWVIVTPASDYTLTGIATSSQLKYRKDSIGTLQLQGQIYSDYVSGPPAPTCTTLPAGFRPVVDRFIPVLKLTGSTYTMIWAWIRTTGEIELSIVPTTDDLFEINIVMPL